VHTLPINGVETLRTPSGGLALQYNWNAAALPCTSSARQSLRIA
jgi:hypothetical protein